MFELDRHTHQINLWLALAEPDPIFSDSLASAGYSCQVVEDEYYISDADGDDIINPDLILVSSEHDHALIIECKSEGLDTDQIRRYTKVRDNPEALVSQGVVQDVSARRLSAETTISSFTNLTDFGIPSELSVVHFEYNNGSGLVVWNLDEHQISEPNARGTFPVNAHPEADLPTGYYPFDIYEADKEEMVIRIFTTVIGRAATQGTVDLQNVLEICQPYWDKLGEGKKTELQTRADKIFSELLEAGLDEYLEKVAGTNGREWKSTSKTIQALGDSTDYYVERVMDNLDQARLDHDAWSVGSYEPEWSPEQSEEDESEADDE